MVRNAKKKAVSEGKIIVFAMEEESDEAAITRHAIDAGPRTDGV